MLFWYQNSYPAQILDNRSDTVERFFECSKEWRQILKLTESPSEQPNMYMNNNNNNMWKRKHDRGNKWHHTSKFLPFHSPVLAIWQKKQSKSLKGLCELIVRQWQSILTLDAYEIWFLLENTLNIPCIKRLDLDKKIEK